MGDIEGAIGNPELTLNGEPTPLKTLLKNGDVIWTGRPRPQEPKPEEIEPEEAEQEEIEPEEPEEAEPEEIELEEAEPEEIRQEDYRTKDGAREEPEPKTGNTGESQPSKPEIPQPREILFYLNDAPLYLPAKADGERYYLMDLIEYSGVDLKEPKGRVILSVNGESAMFRHALAEGDRIQIQEEI